jgi:heat shock protein HtpX
MGNTLKTALLLTLLSGLLLLIGQWLGGQSGLVIAFAFAIVMNFGSYWFSDKVVLRMYRATEVGPDHPLHQMTARLARRAQLPMPRVYVIPDQSPNAFATGRDPEHAAVAATEGLLRLLHEHELEGVIAHELAHVRHRDILISSVAATIAATIMMLASMARWAAIFGGFGGTDERRGGSPFALILTSLVAPLAAGLIQAAISRSREFAADRRAAEIAGNPLGLADALRKIEAASHRVPMHANPATAHMFIMTPFSERGMMSLFSTHPPVGERVRALLGTV